MELEGGVAKVIGRVEMELRAGIWVGKGAGGPLTGRRWWEPELLLGERPQAVGNQDRAALASSSMHSSLAWVVSCFQVNWFCFSMLIVKPLDRSTDRCGSVGWASSCKAKVCCFHSQSGHMPGLWVPSLVGVHTRGN